MYCLLGRMSGEDSEVPQTPESPVTDKEPFNVPVSPVEDGEFFDIPESLGIEGETSESCTKPVIGRVPQSVRDTFP